MRSTILAKGETFVRTDRADKSLALGAHLRAHLRPLLLTNVLPWQWHATAVLAQEHNSLALRSTNGPSLLKAAATRRHTKLIAAACVPWGCTEP